MIKLDKFTAQTQYPCHSQRKVYFQMFPIVPIQKFDRRCPICHRKWIITCSVLRRDEKGITLTKAEWE